MSSQEIDQANHNNQRKLVKKEKKKNLAKQTKMIRERLGSAVSSCFGGKESGSAAMCSLNMFGKSNTMRLEGLSGKMRSLKVPKMRTFLSNLFRKSKIYKISDTNKSESGQGQGKQSSDLTWVWLKGVRSKPKLRIVGPERNRESDRVGDEAEAMDAEHTGNELCKRRILMGGKCKPLEVSDVLHYGDNGMIFPER